MNEFVSRALLFLVLSVGLATLPSCAGDVPEIDSAAERLLAGRDALAKNDFETAIRELSASIELKADSWAYVDRATAYAKSGDDANAKSDIEAGLALDPENGQLKWLLKELRKQPSSRFKNGDSIPVVGK